MGTVYVSAGFDDLRSRDIRLLQEAARTGPLHVLLWSDEAVARCTGHPPKFGEAERRYFVEAQRYVDRLSIVDIPDADSLPSLYVKPSTSWVIAASQDTPAKQQFCERNTVGYRVLQDSDLDGYPLINDVSTADWTGRKKVIVTGCYDWFHSGHVRFFEEVSELGDLIVVVGHDANIKLLKGEGHPMYSEDERRYMAGSVRFVKLALVSSGDGWLDAEPEIERVHPDMYAVNEDGDRPEKKEYCAARGIEYKVLKRLPKEGLPKRQSTDLRGF